jgi:flagellar biosynthesis chaperone FliJ
MTTTETTGFDVRRSLLANDVSQDLANVIGRAVNDLQSTETQLRQLGAQITAKVAEVNHNLDHGFHLNRLGELQSMGPRYDQLVAQRQAQVETVVTLASLLPYTADQDYVVAVMEGKA